MLRLELAKRVSFDQDVVMFGAEKLCSLATPMLGAYAGTKAAIRAITQASGELESSRLSFRH